MFEAWKVISKTERRLLKRTDNFLDLRKDCLDNLNTDFITWIFINEDKILGTFKDTEIVCEGKNIKEEFLNFSKIPLTKESFLDII